MNKGSGPHPAHPQGHGPTRASDPLHRAASPDNSASRQQARERQKAPPPTAHFRATPRPRSSTMVTSVPAKSRGPRGLPSRPEPPPQCPTAQHPLDGSPKTVPTNAPRGAETNPCASSYATDPAPGPCSAERIARFGFRRWRPTGHRHQPHLAIRTANRPLAAHDPVGIGDHTVLLAPSHRRYENIGEPRGIGPIRDVRDHSKGAGRNRVTHRIRPSPTARNISTAFKPWFSGITGASQKARTAPR